MYVMDSEPEIDHKFADLTMIIRPDKRHFKIFDVLNEFKFVTLKYAGAREKRPNNYRKTTCTACRK